MTGPEFPPEVRRALDSLTVPPLPEGFAERVVARALADERSRPPAPLRTSRWRRARRIAAGVGLGGLLAATAAAAGWFGAPVRVPVISDLIQRLAPPALPARPVVPSPAEAAPKPAAAAAEPTVAAAPPPSPGRAPQAPVAEATRAVAPAAPPAPPAPRPAPSASERAELRREALRPPLEPSPAPAAAPLSRTADAVEPVATAPAIRETPAARATAVPREVRPAERLRPPARDTRPARAPTTTERRRQLRERRVP